MIQKEFENLELYTENGDFVEYRGDLYYIGDDIESLESEGFEFEDGEIEETHYLAARRNVGCTKNPSRPYVEGFDLGQQDDFLYEGKRAVHKDLKTGVLPDSDDLILRELVTIPDEIPEHVVYDEKTDAYFCISNVCEECDVKPRRVPAEYVVVSADIAAQEPLASTIVTREPKWQEVFELKNFRVDPSLLQYMDIIAESYLKIPKRDLAYVMWIHDTYFYDRTEIYKLNYLVNSCKIDASKIGELKDYIQYLIDKFNEYREEKGYGKDNTATS